MEHSIYKREISKLLVGNYAKLFQRDYVIS